MWCLKCTGLGTSLVEKQTGCATDEDTYANVWLGGMENSSVDLTVRHVQVFSYGPATEHGPVGLVLATKDQRLFRRYSLFEFSEFGVDPGRREKQKNGSNDASLGA